MVLVVAATEMELRGARTRSDCETLVCGVGPVDASCAVAERLAMEPPVSAVLHIGIAGVRESAGIPVCSFVVGSSSVYCDSRSRLVIRELDADPQLVRAVMEALPEARSAVIGTSADVGGSHSCDVEAMEGFGVLRAAQRVGIPAVEVRCISNEIEQEDRARWDIAGALEALEHALPVLANALIEQREV
jgi:futalosine hydrolase